MLKNTAYIFSAILLITASCKQKSSNNGSASENTDAAIEKQISPDFNADSSFVFVKKQVDFGPRIPGTPAHAACAQFLQQKLKSYGANVFIQNGQVQTYDKKTYTLKNIIAAFSPEKTKRVLVTAHWDTRPFSDQDPEGVKKAFDGANDGGSGVGVILEMARLIQQKKPDVGVDFILWDLEDYGQPDDGGGFPPQEDTYCLGSQYWQKNPPVKGYSPMYAINLDMVGGLNAQFRIEGYSEQYASDIVKKVWDTGNAIGYSSYFLYKTGGEIYDDHLWINKANIPAIDIIHFDETSPSTFYRHWHTQKDNMAGIDKNSLKAAGQTVLEVLFRENVQL
jgi:Zn-dependent M28 family amino/carboxypeptidase